MVREAGQLRARALARTRLAKNPSPAARIFRVSWVEPRFPVLSSPENQKSTDPVGVGTFLVREAGLEPARP